jgi:hypothetical protein
MQTTADYLRTKGVDIVWGPSVRETSSRAEICDPNGFHIELRQWFRGGDAFSRVIPCSAAAGLDGKDG